MLFEDFKKHIPVIEKLSLSVLNSHQKMEPQIRKKLMQLPEYTDRIPKKAAVLMLVYPKNDKATLALIVRKKSHDVHSSQIAFPGGKHEDNDDNYQETALRETFEEIGVHQYRVHLIRSFSEVYIPVSNFLVYPFLATAKAELIFSPCPDEVELVIEIPIEKVLNENSVSTVCMDTSYAQQIDVPVFKFDNYVVWGATAMMLSELKDALKVALFEK